MNFTCFQAVKKMPLIWWFLKIAYLQNWWFITQNDPNKGWFGGHLFSETALLHLVQVEFSVTKPCCSFVTSWFETTICCGSAIVIVETNKIHIRFLSQLSLVAGYIPPPFLHGPAYNAGLMPVSLGLRSIDSPKVLTSSRAGTSLPLSIEPTNIDAGDRSAWTIPNW